VSETSKSFPAVEIEDGAFMQSALPLAGFALIEAPR
jgi:hypothetical protein